MILLSDKSKIQVITSRLRESGDETQLDSTPPNIIIPHLLKTQARFPRCKTNKQITQPRGASAKPDSSD
ncbi:hypothetical protein Pmani_030967 [Petrolisthes manimaculis]|uniref:Uncharacterized protein n=1 Tax=Petrolisthes manimaculis TaxID=1843537 RepID=A0AAE1NWN9_9EUCA|nr:hypothetical protein Pmani_030967 [Petrolisthes manimaculis]